MPAVIRKIHLCSVVDLYGSLVNMVQEEESKVIIDVVIAKICVCDGNIAFCKKKQHSNRKMVDFPCLVFVNVANGSF